MDKIFAWKTINEQDVFATISYSYNGEKNKNNIDDWSSLFYDLEIKVEAKIENEITDFLFEDEKAAWMISWRGDNKITGTSSRITIEPNVNQNLHLLIPAGSILNELEIELLIVTQTVNSNFSKQRLDSSILCEKTLYKKNTLSESSFFPIREIYGDGKLLFTITSNFGDDLTVSMNNAICVNVDRKHAFLKNIDQNIEARNLMLLMIIQSFFQIAIMNSEIFSQTDSDENYLLFDCSIGKSFFNILTVVKDELNLNTIEDLRNWNYNKREEINNAIVRIYSKVLTK